ncbi:MAG: MBL fold metallo-hydrolase [Ktedonobacteraceae bacterium]|nr:MBL fold metallo-hydrolase [Ktedonobacteraceae bacterium]
MADSGLEHPDAPVSAPEPAQVEPLADGVYALVTGGDPNTGFIVGERGVVVVDARATPALARETLTAIRGVTDKPIRYLVLTHYHAVRVLGASALGAEHIVAHRGTRYLINERGQQDFESEARRFPRLFLDIKSIPGLTHPDICYDDTLILDLGDREVQLRWLGRAHTEGDTAVWLPAEHILFAGDLVEASAAPYCGDAYILDWPATLQNVRTLGARKLIPGRGAVVEGEAVAHAIDETQAYLTTLRDSVRAVVLKEAGVAEAYQAAQQALTPRFGDWAIFKHCLPFNVQRMYDELAGTRPRIWTESRDSALWQELAHGA